MWCHKLLRREKREMCELLVNMAGERIKSRDAIHFIAEELDAQRLLIRTGRVHLDDIAAHAKTTAIKRDVVSLVEHIHELRQHILA